MPFVEYFQFEFWLFFLRSPPATAVSTVSKASAKSEEGEAPAHQEEDREEATDKVVSPEKPATSESKVSGLCAHCLHRYSTVVYPSPLILSTDFSTLPIPVC